MKRNAILVWFIIGMFVFFLTMRTKSVLAQGNDEEKQYMHSLEEIDNGILGDSIVFNSIKIADTDNDWYRSVYGEDLPVGMLRNESNFVGARVDNGQNLGKYNKWDDNVKVEDGKTYIVRIYAHNNNPNGENAVAENVKVRFFVPTLSSTSITINGYINSANAGKYVDDVVFESDIPFHLEYVEGSALLENSGFASGTGQKLSDSVVDHTANGQGALIGYNGFDGYIPGCYKYTNYVTISVKAVLDYEFATEMQVRLVNSEDRTWQKTVEAKVGDKVEFQIEYINLSSIRQENVAIKDILPSNLHYVAGSTKIKNENHPKGDNVLEDHLVSSGLGVGNYGPNANVYLLFIVEVIDDNLEEGSNTLVNWGQVGVGETVKQDYARVVVYKNTGFKVGIGILLTLAVICLMAVIILFCKIRKLKHTSMLHNHESNKGRS